MDTTYQQLVEQIKRLEADIRRLESRQIVVVGDFDGTDVPVTINGVRRKIITSSP